MIPASWDWQKKTKIWQAGLQRFCFTLPHSRSECTLAHFFVSVFIRVIRGFLSSFSVAQCDLLVRSFQQPTGGARLEKNQPQPSEARQSAEGSPERVSAASQIAGWAQPSALGMREGDCLLAARRARELERASQMIPTSWDWQKKTKIRQAR